MMGLSQNVSGLEGLFPEPVQIGAEVSETIKLRVGIVMLMCKYFTF